MKTPSRRRFWTERELDFVRRDYGRVPVAEIAVALRRTVGSVYQQADRLRLTKHPKVDWTRLDCELRRLHALGRSDAEIATELRRIAGRELDRRTVGGRRVQLGLSHNASSDHRRRRVAEKTKAQCALAGVATLADIRVQSWQDAAARCGWPRDLRPRAVQILNTLYQRGPMTRRQIAEAIGLPWNGSRKSLTSRDTEGIYLWHLVRRGLVVRLPRLVKGTGKGRSTHLYTLALGVAPHFEQEAS